MWLFIEAETTTWPLILAFGSTGFSGAAAAGGGGGGAAAGAGAAGAFASGGTPEAWPASSCFVQAPVASRTTARANVVARRFVMRRNLTQSGIVPSHASPR